MQGAVNLGIEKFNLQKNLFPSKSFHPKIDLASSSLVADLLVDLLRHLLAVVDWHSFALLDGHVNLGLEKP